uniref:ethanolamine-phosphate cytidylyltransferase n=1 Tax=Lotharella globosa TaxID=91324 RepID=A0A7S3YZ91_9EUKA
MLCNSKTLARTPSCSRFMKTSSILTSFRGSGMMTCEPKKLGKDDKIVYIDGDWDMFNAKHIRILTEAKALGDFLIVGVHNDQLVAEKTKSHGNFPIMDLHERVLSVMGCKHVGDVLLDAPWTIGRDVISTLNLDIVVRGTRYIDDGDNEDIQRYKVPQEMKIFRTIDATNPSLTASSCSPVHDIIKRIQENRARFQARFRKKKAKEDAYYENKHSQLESSLRNDES